MTTQERIYVAGHRGLVGSAIVRALAARGIDQPLVRTRAELDLTDQRAVREFFLAERPTQVYLAAARVGGILANNTLPADFIYTNLAIQTNVIEAAHQADVRKLCFLGSSCIYPRLASQPITESALLTGPLEPTNEAYAIAKIAGIKMAQAYRRQYGFDAISLMPTNLYGPGDNFHAEQSHVVPALLRRFHEAKLSAASEVVIWGTGNPLREFLYVDDLADAACCLMKEYSSPEIINVGTGTDVTIGELARTTREVVGYAGALRFDPTKPDGAPRKLLDVSRIAALGWHARTTLRVGLERTYAWYCANETSFRR